MSDERIDITEEVNAAPYAVCGRCQRRTWAPTDFGEEDRMTQPDGYPCGGRFTDPGGAVVNLDSRIQQVRARVEGMTTYGDCEHVALAHAVLHMLDTPADCSYGGPDHHEAWNEARTEMITRLIDSLTEDTAEIRER